MAKIIWIGNMTWSAVENGNQPWDKELRPKIFQTILTYLTEKIIYLKHLYRI